MGKGKYLIISMTFLALLLASSSIVIAQDDGPVRINESFVLGDTGCQMNVALEGDAIVAATVSPAFAPPPEPPGIYVFEFTGYVPSTAGSLPFDVSAGDQYTGTPFSGTLTYAPSTLELVIANPDENVYHPVESTIADISITYYLGDGSSQSFETTDLEYLGTNNDALSTGTAIYDRFVFSSFVSSDPLLEEANPIRFNFTLVDWTASVFSGLDIPTNLNFEDWTNNYLTVSPVGNAWAVYGTLLSLEQYEFQAKNKAASAAVQQSTSQCNETLTVENISATVICDDNNEDGEPDDPSACLEKTAVEQNIMEKSGDGSRYCYYTTTGQRVCKTF